MREPTASRIEQLVKQYMPVGAVGYFFQQITADNRVLRFPESGCFKLIAPFQLPVGVPNGTYQVFFVRSLDETHPLPPRDPEYPYPEVAFYFAPSPATHAAAHEDARPQRRLFGIDDLEQEPELRDARVDYRRRRMAMRLKHREMGITKSQAYTQDLGDAFELNRAYRHELADSVKSMSGVPQRVAEDSVRLMDVLQKMQGMSLDMIAEHRKRLTELANPAPPPPPAWVTMSQQFLPVIFQFATVLLASTKFGSGAPPELMKALSDSLTAMTPTAPMLPAPQMGTTPLPGQPASTASLPAAQPQPKPHALAQQAQPTDSPAKQTDLPPIADGALTVQDLHYILSAFLRADTPESKQILASWIDMAEQLNPERAARRQTTQAARTPSEHPPTKPK